MTLEEFNQIDQELQASGENNKEYLISKGIKLSQYYYWKRKAKEQSTGTVGMEGSFLPIDIQSSGFLGKGKRNKNIPHTYIAQGEIEIELRTPAGAELRIRGFLDPIMVNTIIASAEGRRHV
ncbi:MAG: hypothetical protein WC476_13150 [Phycisphaerae bacterium]|jgi:hypothetical protein